MTNASALAATDEWHITQGATDRAASVQQMTDFIIKRAAAATVAAGDYVTWLVLAANSADITGVTLTTVMTITGVGVGRYHFKAHMVYQTTALTTGVGWAVNHTGTSTQFVVERRHATTGAAAATNAPTEISVNNAGNIYESQGSRTEDTLIGAVSVSVDTANADMTAVLEGFIVVSVSGDLQIKLQAEAAALVCKAMQGSFLELKRLS